MAATWLAECSSSKELTPPKHVYLITNDSAAIPAITNIRSLDNQQSVLRFHSALTRFVSAFPGVGITLAWSPFKRDRDADTTARK
jgi:hypothetical protein